jgi:hypothetical protein
MAVDNAPATNALNLLNGIDYGAVIGAPLQAAITAQAMAAKSTWEFIQEVGLQTDESGNKSAVNVTFTYQKGGELVKLIVPILTIVPIPAIVVTDIEIAFKANINASASQASEQSESTNIGGELSGGAKVGWGPFSIDANFKANYSSKKDSKATQNSQYSVEYTQDVTVKAAQAGIPAGLATVLNILSSAATGASLDGDLMVSPSLITLDINNPQDTRSFSIKVVDSNGLNVKGADVTIKPGEIKQTLALRSMGVQKHHFNALKEGTSITDAIQIGLAPLGTIIEWNTSEKNIVTKTGNDGSTNLIVSLTKNASQYLPLTGNFELIISATIGNKLQEITLPFKVNMPEHDHNELLDRLESNIKDTMSIDPKDRTGKAIVLTLTDPTDKPVEGQPIEVRLKENTQLEVQPQNSTETDDKGTVSFTFKWSDQVKTGEKPEETVIFSATGNIKTEPENVALKVTADQEKQVSNAALPQAQGYRLSFVDNASGEIVPITPPNDTVEGSTNSEDQGQGR